MACLLKPKIKGVYSMAKYKNRKALSVLLIVLSVIIAAGFTYAGTAKTIKFNGTATFGSTTQPDLWLVFDSVNGVVSDPTATGAGNISTGTVSVTDQGLTANLDLRLVEPGSSVTFTYRVENRGTQPATLSTPMYNSSYNELAVTGTYTTMAGVVVPAGVLGAGDVITPGTTGTYTMIVTRNLNTASAPDKPGDGWNYSFDIKVDWAIGG